MASTSAMSCVRPASSFMITIVSTVAIGTPSLTGAWSRPSSTTRSASVSGTWSTSIPSNSTIGTRIVTRPPACFSKASSPTRKTISSVVRGRVR